MDHSHHFLSDQLIGHAALVHACMQDSAQSAHQHVQKSASEMLIRGSTSRVIQPASDKGAYGSCPKTEREHWVGWYQCPGLCRYNSSQQQGWSGVHSRAGPNQNIGSSRMSLAEVCVIAFIAHFEQITLCTDR